MDSERRDSVFGVRQLGRHRADTAVRGRTPNVEQRVVRAGHVPRHVRLCTREGCGEGREVGVRGVDDGGRQIDADVDVGADAEKGTGRAGGNVHF